MLSLIHICPALPLQKSLLVSFRTKIDFNSCRDKAVSIKLTLSQRWLEAVGFFFPLNKVFILEQLQVYRKTEKVVQRLSIHPVPSFPIVNILQLMNQFVTINEPVLILYYKVYSNFLSISLMSFFCPKIQDTILHLLIMSHHIKGIYYHVLSLLILTLITWLK